MTRTDWLETQDQDDETIETVSRLYIATAAQWFTDHCPEASVEYVGDEPDIYIANLADFGWFLCEHLKRRPLEGA